MATKTRNGPHILCVITARKCCVTRQGKSKGLPFGIPMTWREPRDHITDCYFCLVNTTDIGMINRHKISYPSIPSAIPVFKDFLPSEDVSSDQEQETADETQEMLSESGDPSYETPQSLTLQQISQPELNDLVRDLGLSKNAAEVLASRLQEKN